MNLSEFILEAEDYSRKQLSLRKGQAYWDYAINVFGIAKLQHLVDTDADPFHNDGNLPLFLVWIEELL